MAEAKSLKDLPEYNIIKKHLQEPLAGIAFDEASRDGTVTPDESKLIQTLRDGSYEKWIYSELYRVAIKDAEITPSESELLRIISMNLGLKHNEKEEIEEKIKGELGKYKLP